MQISDRVDYRCLNCKFCSQIFPRWVLDTNCALLDEDFQKIFHQFSNNPKIREITTVIAAPSVPLLVTATVTIISVAREPAYLVANN